MLRPTRRAVIATGAAALAMPRLGFAQAPLPLTPAQAEGPFYPDIMPTDTDADLVRIADLARDAGGQILQLSGRVLNEAGAPVEGAIVEIWQCDANGIYHHSRDGGPETDQYFQGFGRSLAGADGGYRFRTIRPVSYPGRTPHIHFKIYRRDAPVLTTQMYVAGEAGNAGDGLYRSLNPAEQALVTVDLRNGSGDAEWEGQFDLVLPA